MQNCCEQAVKESQDWAFVTWLMKKYPDLAFKLQAEYNKNNGF